MAGIFDEIIGMEQRRSHGEYALDGIAPNTVAELEESMNAAERADMLTEAGGGNSPSERFRAAVYNMPPDPKAFRKLAKKHRVEIVLETRKAWNKKGGGIQFHVKLPNGQYKLYSPGGPGHGSYLETASAASNYGPRGTMISWSDEAQAKWGKVEGAEHFTEAKTYKKGQKIQVWVASQNKYVPAVVTADTGSTVQAELTGPVPIGWDRKGSIVKSIIKEDVELTEEFGLLNERGEYVGHIFKDGKDFYVDTAFVQLASNNASKVLPGFTLRHMGFGEFSMEGPGGASIEFDRMRGRDFPGQSGRSHKLYGDKKAIQKLVKSMVNKGHAQMSKKSKTPTPKAVAKRTGMKVRAKTRGALQQKLYDYFMDVYDQEGRQRPWRGVHSIAAAVGAKYTGPQFEKLLKSLDAMVKSGLLDKSPAKMGTPGKDDQYRLAEWAPARPIEGSDPDEVELPVADLAILNAISEAEGGVLSAPKIAEVTGLPKSDVRSTLDSMARENVVARTHPAGDVWRITHFGEACKAHGKKRKKDRPKRGPAKMDEAKSVGFTDEEKSLIRKTMSPKQWKQIEKYWASEYKKTGSKEDKAHRDFMRSLLSGGITEAKQLSEMSDVNVLKAASGAFDAAQKRVEEMTEIVAGKGSENASFAAQLRHTRDALKYAARDISAGRMGGWWKSEAKNDWPFMRQIQHWNKKATKEARKAAEPAMKWLPSIYKVLRGAKLHEAEEKGSYKAQGPLEKMIGEMVRGQSGKWLSKSQMKAIVNVLAKKGITKPTKDSYDDIARIVGKTLASMMKKEST